jgi:hypothetical protein
MFTTVRRVQNLPRYREIITVFVRHGFGSMLEQMGVDRALVASVRIFRRDTDRERLSPAQHFRLALEELGPTFVKLGQILSTRPDLLPPDYIHELSKLQDTVPPASWENVYALIQEELEQPPEEVFAYLDPEPLAAASLAQVHSATLPDGSEVVVKVQRPHILETIDTDLEILADMAQLERKIGKLESDIKGDKKLIPLYEMAQSLRDYLAQGNAARTYPQRDSAIFEALNREMRFLTAKPVIYAVNVDETGLAEETPETAAVREIAAAEGAEVVVFCAKLEEEMLDMTPEEQREFLELVGASESGLEQVVRKGFDALNLITFFTKNENEVRAWTIPAGTKAPQAAGKIHTDFERGFIRAEVVDFETFAEHGSDAAVRAAGLMRSEGKDYAVQDGDVLLFRFNV